MLPNQFDHEMYRRDMEREAEQHTLARIATEGTPNLFQRVASHLPQVEFTAPSLRIVMKQPTEIAVA